MVGLLWPVSGHLVSTFGGLAAEPHFGPADGTLHESARILSMRMETLLLFVWMTACATSSAGPDVGVQNVSDTNEQAASSEALEGVLRIDAKSRSKRFQGVWLEQSDGVRLLLSYRTAGCWEAFKDRAVQARGAFYEPEGQSIGAPHFRVDTLSLASEDPAALYVSLGREQDLEGQFSWSSGAAGSKQEGERLLTFKSDTSYALANPSKAERFSDGSAVMIKARTLTRSPYSAHTEGPLLWLMNIRKAQR